MQWIKKLWFPLAAVVLLGIIGYNLSTVARLQRSSPSSSDQSQGVASQGSGSRGSGTRSGPASADRTAPPEDLVSEPGPRKVILRLETHNNDIDGEKLSADIESLSPVAEASIKENTLTLTISNTLTLVEVNERLSAEKVDIADSESPLGGGLRLHVSGMTCQGCASALRKELGGMDGVEVKGPIDLRNVEEGYAQVFVAESAGLTLAKLKAAIKNTPFELEDVQWPVRPPDGEAK